MYTHTKFLFRIFKVFYNNINLFFTPFSLLKGIKLFNNLKIHYLILKLKYKSRYKNSNLFLKYSIRSLQLLGSQIEFEYYAYQDGIKWNLACAALESFF